MQKIFGDTVHINILGVLERCVCFVFTTFPSVLELQNKLARNIVNNHTVLVKYKYIHFFDNIRELNLIMSVYPQ